jgi:hypothetical protein
VHLAQVRQDQLAGAQIAGREEAGLAVGGVFSWNPVSFGYWIHLLLKFL